MNIKVPTGWRKGQTIFNFLWWLKEKGFPSEVSGFDPETARPVYAETRMADPFHLQDEDFDKLFTEFLDEHKGKEK